MNMSIKDFFFFKANRDVYINSLLENIENLKNENEEKNKVIECYKKTNLNLLEELKKFENFKINMGKGRSKIDLNLNLIISLKNQGFSNVKIAEYLNVTEGTIRNRLKNK